MPLNEAAYEAMEGWESESEAAERAPRRPSSQPSFKPRPAPNAPNYVTQTQLEAALTRVDGKIKTVSDGVATINTRLTSLSTAFKKEADERKKTVDNSNKDLNQKLQLLAILPLLVKPASVTGPQIGGNPLADANNVPIPAVSVPDSNSLNAILPLLLVSGMGGSGGLGFGGDTSSGGSDSSMMMMALVLAFASK
jgi:hypothetical protein